MPSREVRNPDEPPLGMALPRWIFRMAFSVIKSMGKFVGSGMKTVSAETHGKRLQACGSCPRHTGVRSRLCGCFTNVKAWLPHEDCPIGKWPG
jgi:hypothetical protein